MSAQPNTRFFWTCRVRNTRVLQMTASSCRARSLLPPGLSLYPGLLSLCDVQLPSPFPTLLYSTCAAASCFVLCASAVTRAESAALLPASELVAASRVCAACGGCCIHLSCHATLMWGQRFLSGRGILAKCIAKTLFIYLRCANWVLLGTHNVTKSRQCFHGAEGMLVKLRSSSVKIVPKHAWKF